MLKSTSKGQSKAMASIFVLFVNMKLIFVFKRKNLMSSLWVKTKNTINETSLQCSRYWTFNIWLWLRTRALQAINDRQSLTVVKIFRGKNRTPALKWLLLGKRKEIFIIYIYLLRFGFSDYCTEVILSIDFKSNLYGLQFYHTSNHIITNAF